MTEEKLESPPDVGPVSAEATQDDKLWGLLCWALALCIFVAVMAGWEGSVPPVWALLLNALVVLVGAVLVGWSGWSSFRRYGAIRPGRRWSLSAAARYWPMLS